MKKIVLSLIALVSCMSTNAQTMKIYKGETLVATYKASEADKVIFSDDHEYVDLGLPSGTLWATCNIGASKPEEYGDYYAWGEIVPQSNNTQSWATYKWCNGAPTSLTKYCTNSEYGYVDNKTELESSDDAATINWGNNWQIPTKSQEEELLNTNYTTTTWTTQNGVYGRLITSKMSGYTDKSIFLPAAGLQLDGGPMDLGDSGYYLSRNLNSTNCYLSCCIGFYSEGILLDNRYRSYGYSVRAVRVQN